MSARVSYSVREVCPCGHIVVEVGAVGVDLDDVKAALRVSYARHVATHTAGPRALRDGRAT